MFLFFKSDLELLDLLLLGRENLLQGLNLVRLAILDLGLSRRTTGTRLGLFVDCCRPRGFGFLTLPGLRCLGRRLPADCREYKNKGCKYS
jgi:hypothetical protein